MKADGSLIVGIDGGGSNTRVAVSDADGRLLAYREFNQAASRHKDGQAKRNVQAAIRSTLAEAGLSLRDVAGVAAGIAGFDDPKDLEWVRELTDLEEMPCPKWHVNDAGVAHYGALTAKPGIVAIAGTGSILFGINEEGSQLRNYDFRHYAASAARFLSYDAVFEALAGFADESDQGVVAAMLAHWGTASLAELSDLGRQGFHANDQERMRLFSSFAPVLTKAASEGSALARTVCDRAIRQMAVGIRMLGNYFAERPVAVACIGSVANSPYFKQRLERTARDPGGDAFQLVEPRFPPAVGALLYAFERLQIPIAETVTDHLAATLPVAIADNRPMEPE